MFQKSLYRALSMEKSFKPSILEAGVTLLLSSIDNNVETVNIYEIPDINQKIFKNKDNSKQLYLLYEKLINIKRILLRFQKKVQEQYSKISLDDFLINSKNSRVVDILNSFNNSNLLARKQFEDLFKKIFETNEKVNSSIGTATGYLYNLGEIVENPKYNFKTLTPESLQVDNVIKILQQQLVIGEVTFSIEILQEIFSKLPPRIKGIAKNEKGSIVETTLPTFSNDVDLVIEELELKIKYNSN